jgi:hypothetical protein
MQDILQIKVDENLCDGLIIKNYKELSILLGEEIKAGKSKQLQLDNWKRYFDFEKEGQKIIITRVFNKPVEKINNKGKSEGSRGNNAIYVKYIETLLLHMLSQEEGQTLVCTKNYLMVALGITNRRYTDKHTRKMLVKSNAFKEYEINEFDRRAYQILDRILFSALNSLQSRFLLNWKQELHYEKINEVTGKSQEYIATEDEERRYTAIKYEVLKDMGEVEGKPEKYDQLRDIYFYNKADEFYDMLRDKLYDEFGWDKTYIMYRIIFTRSNVIDAIPRTENQLQEKLELNDKVVTALNNNAESRYNNLLTKFQNEYDELCIINGCDFDTMGYDCIKAYRPPKNYVDRQQMIAEELVRIKNKSIKKAI